MALAHDAPWWNKEMLRHIHLNDFFEKAWTDKYGNRAFWFDAFLSHNRDDESGALAADLQQHGVRVWHDAHGDLRNRKVREKVSLAIRQSRYVVVCVPPGFRDSAWCRAEYLPALDVEREAGTTRVLVVVLGAGDAAVPPPLASCPRFELPADVGTLARTLVSGNRVDGLLDAPDLPWPPDMPVPEVLGRPIKGENAPPGGRTAEATAMSFLRILFQARRDGRSMHPQAPELTRVAVCQTPAAGVGEELRRSAECVAFQLVRSKDADDRANAAYMLEWLLAAEPTCAEWIWRFVAHEHDPAVIKLLVAALSTAGRLDAARARELHVPLLRAAYDILPAAVGLVLDALHPAVRIRLHARRGIDEALLTSDERVGLACERLDYLLPLAPCRMQSGAWTASETRSESPTWSWRSARFAPFSSRVTNSVRWVTVKRPRSAACWLSTTT